MKVFLQGFAIVALTAMNVVAISRHSIAGAFAVSFAISLLWWSNTRAANRDGSRWAYAFGAACGAATVVWLS